MMPDCELLSDRELWELLKEQKPFVWKYVLTVVKEQEEKSLVNSRKRESWGVDLYELLGKLYEDMICNRKLWNYKGANEDTPGSLIGWMRSYLRGYLTRLNPDYRNKAMDFDGEVKGKDGEKILSVGDQYAKEMSDGTNLFAYKDEDLEVLKHERLEIAQKCFADLWRENSSGGGGPASSGSGNAPGSGQGGSRAACRSPADASAWWPHCPSGSRSSQTLKIWPTFQQNTAERITK